MELRKKLNENVRNTGNRMKDGLGDILTKEIKLQAPLSVAGAIGGIMTWGGIICNGLYKTGVVDAMYSDSFWERLSGIGVNTIYTAVYLMALPLWGLGGVVVGNYVGKQLDRI